MKKFLIALMALLCAGSAFAKMYVEADVAAPGYMVTITNHNPKDEDDPMVHPRGTAATFYGISAFWEFNSDGKIKPYAGASFAHSLEVDAPLLSAKGGIIMDAFENKLYKFELNPDLLITVPFFSEYNIFIMPSINLIMGDSSRHGWILKTGLAFPYSYGSYYFEDSYGNKTHYKSHMFGPHLNLGIGYRF